jgi:hypothetical protein
LTYVFQFLLLQVLASEGLDDPHGFQTLLHHRDDFRLLFAYFVRGFLHRLLESRDKEQQEGGHPNRDHGEVPIEPEHQTEHGNDSEQVNQDVQGRGGGEALDGLNIGGHRAQKSPRLMGIVVAERKALQMVVGPHAQIISHPLADTLGVIVVDIARDRADQSNHHERQCR